MRILRRRVSFFNCPEVEVIERNKDGKIEISFKTQMDREAKEGIIDVPLLFTFEKNKRFI